MHDIKLIRDDPAAFDNGLKRRGLPPQSAEILKRDAELRALLDASADRAGAPQRSLQADRPGQGEEGRGAGARR